MKRQWSAAAALLVAAVAIGEGQAPLTSLSQVRALSNAHALEHLPVSLDATVIYARPSDYLLFVQDGSNGIFTNISPDVHVQLGDRVRIEGITDANYSANLIARKITVLAHGSLPAPASTTFPELIQGRRDCLYVKVRGRVLAASRHYAAVGQVLQLQLQLDGGSILVYIDEAGPRFADGGNLLDDEISVTGVAGGEFDGKMQMVGVEIRVSSLADVQILNQARNNPWTMPLTPMDQILAAYNIENRSRRVHVAGTLTYYVRGVEAVLQKGDRSILVHTNGDWNFKIGQGVEATGFPASSDLSLSLTEGQMRGIQDAEPVTARHVSWQEASKSHSAYDLVSMEGIVVAEAREPTRDLLILSDGLHLFSAVYELNSVPNGQQPFRFQVVEGSRIRVTGVCFVEPGNHWAGQLWFEIRMRVPQDLTLLQPASWWTARRLAYVISLLAFVILAAVFWAWLLRSKIHQQTQLIARKSEEESARERRMAQLAQQRSRILEAVNSSQPLHLVLEEILATMCVLNAESTCWFDLADGTHVGQMPTQWRDSRLTQLDLLSPTGRRLGSLSIARPSTGIPEPEEETTLAQAAKLAALALETRRLYSDLIHRSEFDLLTDIPNRFCFEKRLDQVLDEAKARNGLFAVLYIDLDFFKQINDRYGHRTGDLYLQQVTLRMKAQLRGGDMLARLGGDEFGALVVHVRSRADAEEIAMRLERCMDDPFSIIGYTLHGSASVGIAVYPEDGATKDELQSKADTAMYAHKQRHKLEELADLKLEQARYPGHPNHPGHPEHLQATGEL